jgi:thiol-disulfide isomerase/thioredoxin
MEWVGSPVALATLRGRWVLLDFWSSGCINCVHLLPVLEAIAHRWADRLTVIGVHSGKFPAERELVHVTHECARRDVQHPVLNDRHFRVWRSYAVRAWPTLVLIDPAGSVVAQHAGEISVEALYAALVRITGYDPPLSAAAAVAERVVPQSLRYPSRIACHADGTTIAISDSGHHRLLLGHHDAARSRLVITQVVGGTAPGFVNGDAAQARFHDPQGLAFAGDWLLVADRANHAIRRVAPDTGAVTTRAGNGHRLRTDADRAAGALASPMDLCPVDGMVVIAMAGNHQLWAMPLEQRAPRVVAGTGAEGLHDGPAMEAAFAQPTGLGRTAQSLLVADCESSAIRTVQPADAPHVGTVVGTGLFDFGDRDGVGDAVRLQHPEALVVTADQRVLVIDRYNGAVKWVDPATRSVHTHVRGLQEPTGACALPHDGSLLVVESHASRVVHVEADGRVTELPLHFS